MATTLLSQGFRQAGLCFNSPISRTTVSGEQGDTKGLPEGRGSIAFPMEALKMSTGTPERPPAWSVQHSVALGERARGCSAQRSTLAAATTATPIIPGSGTAE